MANTYVDLLIHTVFSTKNRQPFINPVLQERLYPYMGGIARENEFKTLCIGGVRDHVHILLSLNSRISIAKAIQLIKGGSSKWIHETFPNKNYLRGKRDTELLVSVFHRLMPQENILRIRKCITVR